METEGKTKIHYVLYAVVNNTQTEKHTCADWGEIHELFHDCLQDEIQEELLYQSIEKQEEEL